MTVLCNTIDETNKHGNNSNAQQQVVYRYVGKLVSSKEGVVGTAPWLNEDQRHYTE